MAPIFKIEIRNCVSLKQFFNKPKFGLIKLLIRFERVPVLEEQKNVHKSDFGSS
jgi:hypothetical protein